MRVTLQELIEIFRSVDTKDLSLIKNDIEFINGRQKISKSVDVLNGREEIKFKQQELF